MDFWVISAARHISRVNCAEFTTDKDKLHMKFSLLNLDFDGPSPDFRGSRKPVREGIKEWYTGNSRYFTAVGQSFMKTIAGHHGHAVYHNKR